MSLRGLSAEVLGETCLISHESPVASWIQRMCGVVFPTEECGGQVVQLLDLEHRKSLDYFGEQFRPLWFGLDSVEKWTVLICSQLR